MFQRAAGPRRLCAPALGLVLLAPWVWGGCSSPGGSPSDPAGPGVIFTYPRNGQLDVPVGARLVVSLTNPVNASALASGCTLDASGVPQGALCVVGPDGLVATQVSVQGAAKSVLLVAPAALARGATYQVYARPALLGGAPGNLPDSAPLVTFTTRADRSVAGTPPKLVSVNDDDPKAFQDGSEISPALPFLDLTTLHLLFSEPLDETTVAQGLSFRMVRVDPTTGAETDVPGNLLVQGVHLTFDPDQDLDATAVYKVRLTSDILDKNAEALAPVELTLHPELAAAHGKLYTQMLSVNGPATMTALGSSLSSLAGVTDNSIDAQAPLIGDNMMGLMAGTIQAELADPSAFSGPVPFTIRKGARLDMSPMDIRYDGALESGHQTGAMHMVILSDATGYMMRNPYRPASMTPDDATSPVFVDMTFDAAVYADDPLGNALSNQTVMAFHVFGTATTQGSSLAIENVGTLELNALGVATATLNVALGLKTDLSGQPTPGAADPFTLVDSYPAMGQPDFPVDGRITVTFSHPPDFERVLNSATMILTDQSSNVWPVITQLDGATLVMTPIFPLAYGTSYTLALGPIYDAWGNALSLSASDLTLGTGILSFNTPFYTSTGTIAPMLLALYPGAPCALTGGVPSMPGHCVGGQNTDSSYLEFTLPANRPIDAHFSEPMDSTTFVLGTTCGQGSVRVEKVDSSGTCLGTVPGFIVPRERGFTFQPNSPWVRGQTYQITLVGGTDNVCNYFQEVCSQLGVPLNTRPLNGIANGAGGPDVVIPFVGAAPTDETYFPLLASPYADINGNGYLDSVEAPQDSNQMAIEVVSTGGIVTAASLVGTDCMPDRAGQQVCSALHAELPVSMGAPVASCPVDPDGNPATGQPPCIPTRIYAQSIEGTSLTLHTQAVGFVPVSNDTGMQLMRIRESGPGVYGYVITPPDGTGPEFVVTQHLYIDAPDLSILGGLVGNDLHSKQVDLTLKGPIVLLPDGRMQVALQNTIDVYIDVNISSGPLSGDVLLRIPAGALHLTLRGPAIK